MKRDLDFLFEPRSVAVIGASANPMKWGGFISKQLIECGYKGEVYLVAVKGGVILGRETYKSILEIEGPVDVATIGIPARFVAEAVKDCIKKGVKGIIIITSGFGETGEEGRKIEREMVDMARKGGTRIIGPNCLGIYNSANSLSTTFMQFSPGFFAFLTQSGNYAVDINYGVKQRDLGYSKWVSFGNQIDVRFSEYLDYVKEDPETRVVLLYIEGLFVESVEDGREFLRVAKEITKKKPVVAIKTGTGEAGKRAAVSHTGSLAGDYAIFEGAFKQSGIISVLNSSELLDVGEALGKCPLIKGNRVAILSDGGGHGTMGADAAERSKLEVPVFALKTQEMLRDILPSQSAILNPVDLAGAAEADLWNFSRCAEILLQDEKIDALVIVGAFGAYGLELTEEFTKIEEDVARSIIALVSKYHKPIVVHSMYAPSKPSPLRILSQGGIPVYASVETAMKSLGALVDYTTYLDKGKREKDVSLDLPPGRMDTVKSIMKFAQKSGRVNLLETEARQILRAYNLPVSDFRLAKNNEEAVQAAEELGFPVVMKIVSPDILHKSEAGGVMLGIEDKDEVTSSFETILDKAQNYNAGAQLDGVLIAPMVEPGIEVIVGMTTDQTFGPTLMFGLGGVFVEVLKDVSFRVVPLTREDAYEMIKQIKGSQILEGARGKKPADIEALVDVIIKVSELTFENPEIKELDLNPVFAWEKRAIIGDARIILKS